MVKDIEEILPAGDFSLPLLSELEGQEIEIVAVRFDNGVYGEYAVVTTNKGEYRTGNKVILKQLHSIEKHLKEDNVKCKVAKVKNKYYMLVSPKRK